uniref:Uncharacterized protein n=1 Tax=Rhizophora mucronata TaxID=61149 RepID=A0A2P2MF35_RHIMU
MKFSRTTLCFLIGLVTCFLRFASQGFGFFARL